MHQLLYIRLIDLAYICGAIALGIGLYFILLKLLNRSAKYTGSHWLTLSIKYIKLPLLLILPVLTLKMALPFLSFSDKYIAVLNHILSILMIIAIAVFLVKSIRAIKEIVLSEYTLDSHTVQARKVHTQFKVLEQIVSSLIIIITIGVILMTFEKIREVGLSILASAGIASVILGFSAQKLLGTIVSGVQIAFTQPIRIGDEVIVEGEWGRIEEINLTYVVIQIWDKRRLVIPTTYFIDKPFQNWTRSSSDLLGTVFIYTDYTVPLDQVREELKHILEKTEHWDGKISKIEVTDTSTQAIEVRVLVSAADASSLWNLRVFVREKLIEFLQKNYPDSLPKTTIKMSNGVDNKIPKVTMPGENLAIS